MRFLRAHTEIYSQMASGRPLISNPDICYMLFNQQQCFIYSTASFLSKLRAKKVEKLCILVIKQLQQMTAYRKFRKWNTEIGFRNRERLFPVLLYMCNLLLSTTIDGRCYLVTVWHYEVLSPFKLLVFIETANKM